MLQKKFSLSLNPISNKGFGLEIFSKLISDIYQLSLQTYSLVLGIMKDDNGGVCGGNTKSSVLLA